MAFQGQVDTADDALSAWTESMQFAAGHTASQHALECRALYQLHAIRVSDVRPRAFACVAPLVSSQIRPAAAATTCRHRSTSPMVCRSSASWGERTCLQSAMLPGQQEAARACTWQCAVLLQLGCPAADGHWAGFTSPSMQTALWGHSMRCVIPCCRLSMCSRLTSHSRGHDPT